MSFFTSYTLIYNYKVMHLVRYPALFVATVSSSFSQVIVWLIQFTLNFDQPWHNLTLSSKDKMRFGVTQIMRCYRFVYFSFQTNRRCSLNMISTVLLICYQVHIRKKTTRITELLLLSSNINQTNEKFEFCVYHQHHPIGLE